MSKKPRQKRLTPRQKAKLIKAKQAEISKLMKQQHYVRHGQFYTRVVLVLILFIISSGLLLFSILTGYDNLFDRSFPIANSETMWILIIVAFALPVLLIALLIMVAGEISRQKQNAEAQKYALTNDQETAVQGMEKFDFGFENDKGRLNLDISKDEENFLEDIKPKDKPQAEPNPNDKPQVELTKEEQEELHEARFYMLSKLDLENEKIEKPTYNDKIELKEFCDLFREFACGTLGLYYDISDIRRFVAGLAVTHITILQGMSGTGKTSLAYAFGEFLNNSTVVVPIQPMWKERTDLIGYYNEFTKKFNETTLLQKLYEANYNDEIYITVLDEMNIARVEYYFAEFLSLLELPNPEKRYLDVVSDEWSNDPKLLRNGQLKLPKNMWFIGTANNDDSTFAISDKVYDRAMVINLDKKAKQFEVPVQDSVKVSFSHLDELYTKAQKEYAISERNQRRIRTLDKYLIETFHITFGNRIMKQIKAYVPVMVACGGTELDALDDILSKKVLRKLEAKNPVYVKNASQGLIDFIDNLFGTDKMAQCKEYIINFEQNA